jgi:hypothetical protein
MSIYQSMRLFIVVVKMEPPVVLTWTINSRQRILQGLLVWGLHEEYGDIEDPIIPNSAVAQAYVAALLKESTRKVFSLSFDSPFVNPFIEPGDCIGVTDFETHQENMKWLCEEVSISIEGNDSLMSLTLSRGRT